jgi:hypothetical protein
MVIRTKSCSILGTFCFGVGSVIVLAGARDLLAIGTKSVLSQKFSGKVSNANTQPLFFVNDLSKSYEIEKTSRY